VRVSVLSRPPGLPDFSNPPVVEVALSVQFERLTELHAAHLGLVWRLFKDRFPKTEEHPPREVVSEPFGVFTPPRVRIQLEKGMPIPRVWFLNERGTELIQLQQNCFVHNWRKMRVPEEVYPRYESIRSTFSEELHIFLRFVEQEHLGKVVPMQCEITYVNHIFPGQGWDSFGQVERILAPWSGKHSDPFLPEPEDVRAAIRYLIPGVAGKPVGRLHVEFLPAVDLKTQGQLLVLRLTARGTPDSEQIEDVLAFLDRGREWIVRGFAAITTPNMHRAWGRLDAD
jgi:uncharacterized protein (TIGR04255 family)